MFSCGWLWLYAGALLMLLELLAPGFVIFFFGLAAATVGVVRFVFGEAYGASWQIACFSAFAVLYLVFLRRWMKKTFMGDTAAVGTGLADEYEGRTGRVTAAIAPPRAGRVMIGDSEWSAESDAPIAAGADVRVLVRHNLTLKVEAIP